MGEQRFLAKLEQELYKLNEHERQDIIRDFKEYFESGQAEGKTPDEMIASLGSPKELAEELLKAYSEEEFVQTASTTLEEAFSKVHIDSNTTNVHVLPSPTGQLYTEVKGKGELVDPAISVENDTLKVKIDRKATKVKFFGLKFNLGMSNNSTAIIYLPEKLYEKLKVTNGIGEINIQKLQAKEIVCKADIGSVRLEQVLVSKLNVTTDVGHIGVKSVSTTTATLKSDTGRVSVEQARAENWHLQSDVGLIDLKNVDGAIDASSDAGKISVENESIKRPLKLQTDVGKILVKVVNRLENTTVYAKTDIGKVSIFGERGKRFVYGTGENSIDLRTDIGNITLEQI
ncbi:DUF4097 family beta strand repeat-containing protein [Solibacillus sp. CAU 1738]|uniref:DUF4097 family beta strand repeat-containing protein n=1 Tax=Solibacillus sp. CAU 1738 TaxID=3140363 RepID=UPI0032615D87